MIMIGEAAFSGIKAAMCYMKTVNRNSSATITEVIPVLPPFSTPEALSI